MKPKLISLSTIAAAAIAVSNICVIGTVRAWCNSSQPSIKYDPENWVQARDPRDIAAVQLDTEIGSNPHLRSQSARRTGSPGTTKVVEMSQKDVNFIEKAAAGSAQEVENGKMAEKQAKSAEVKSIAARIVADHTRLNKELTALANRKGVTFNISGVRAQNRGTGDFDRSYLSWLEQAHRADIATFEAAAKSADDKELKAWASKSLPTLRRSVWAKTRRHVYPSSAVDGRRLKVIGT